ncbi:MAG: GNAT family N-acetyltransferase [Bacteroidetes bacterium]|nr:MAG: GNAT family N-acetyltransferase [Bacteroidota bacterium]
MTSKMRYRRFCEHTPELPVFFQAWYLDAVCHDGEWDVAFVEEDGRIRAVFPWFLKKKGPFRYITMPLFVKYLGIFFVGEKPSLKHTHKICDALIDQLPKTDFFIQDFHPSFENWLPFYWRKFRQTTRYTYLLEDLSDLEKVRQNCSRSIRRNIAKGSKRLRIVSNESLEDFFQINKMTFDRQGIPIYYRPEDLQRHDEALSRHNARKMFFAMDEKNQIHAASYLIWDKTRSYYHLAGENPGFRGSGASILLTWEAIRFTREELGLNIFDFEGSMIESIESIRRQFGARQVPYSQIWRYDSKLFQLLSYLKSGR